MASAFEIMRDGPLGGAAFNNEFGRPALLGYFRSFEHAESAVLTRGYDKPIMLAGGLASIKAAHVDKQRLQDGDAVIVLGGPAMLIGLGGGAASSVASGTSSEALRLRLGAARQPGNGAPLPGSHRPLLVAR